MSEIRLFCNRHYYKENGKFKQSDIYSHVAMSKKRGKGIQNNGNKSKYLFKENELISCSITNDSIIFYGNHNPKSFVISPIKGFSPLLSKCVLTNDRIYICGTLFYNLGCSILELNKENQIAKYWTNQDDLKCSFADCIIDKNGSILILCKKWDTKDN